MLNKRVERSVAVERSLGGSMGGECGKTTIAVAKTAGIRTSYSGKPEVTHSGSLLTTTDGSQCLVHKGIDFGDSSDAVAVEGKHMSPHWEMVGESRDVGGRASVGDYIKAAGEDYNLFIGNCHHATSNMQDLGKEGGCGGAQ